jgi:cobalt-zinc-cadmium efflux system outer membrane protein
MSSLSIMKLSIPLALLVALPTSARAIDDPLELAEEAVRENPGLEALRAKSRMLTEIVGAVGTWKDPIVGVEYTNAPVDSFRLDRSPMSGLQFSVQQTLPEWGWSTVTKEASESRAVASRYATAEAEVQLRRTVEVLFWRLTQSSLLRRVTEAHLERTEELLEAVHVHYEVGKVGQNALLRLGVLRDRLRDDLGDFDRIDRELTAGLNGALSRPASSRFAPHLESLPHAMRGTATGWAELAKAHRPLLKQIREEARAEAQEAELARIKTRPEVSVWAKYRLRTVDTPMDDGTDFVSLGIGVPIPWGSRKQGVGQAAAHQEAERGARERLAAAIDRIGSELHIAEATWSRAHDKAITYRESLIPSSRATLETTLADFSVGKAGFASLYESEVDLLMLENTYITATIETHVQDATARAITGASNLGDSQ